MAVNQFWEQPGDMLYDWRSRPWHGAPGPIVSVRDDDSASWYSAARWSPETGWRELGGGTCTS